MFHAIPTPSALPDVSEAADPAAEHASDRLLAADGDVQGPETVVAFTAL